MLIESPAPGMRLAPKHYHMLEEEHALILEGEVTLLLGDERHVMRIGRQVRIEVRLLGCVADRTREMTAQ